MVGGVVPAAKHKQRLPNALNLVVVHIGDAKADVPRRGLRAHKALNAVEDIEGFADDGLGGVPLIRLANDETRGHTQLNTNVLHAVADGDGVERFVESVARDEACHEAVFEEHLADRQGELGTHLDAESIEIGGTHADVRLHLKVLIDRHKGINIEVAHGAVGLVVAVARVERNAVARVAGLDLRHRHKGQKGKGEK